MSTSVLPYLSDDSLCVPCACLCFLRVWRAFAVNTTVSCLKFVWYVRFAGNIKFVAKVIDNVHMEVKNSLVRKQRMSRVPGRRMQIMDSISLYTAYIDGHSKIRIPDGYLIGRKIVKRLGWASLLTKVTVILSKCEWFRKLNKEHEGGWVKIGTLIRIDGFSRRRSDSWLRKPVPLLPENDGIHLEARTWTTVSHGKGISGSSFAWTGGTEEEVQILAISPSLRRPASPTDWRGRFGGFHVAYMELWKERLYSSLNVIRRRPGDDV